jgi:bifunctional non-homologous end joining protein LigD
MTTTIDRADLFCKSGSKDAVYHIQIEQTEGGYVVNFQNGRAGGTLTSKTKTEKPVTLDAARKLFDKTVKSKMTDSPPYLMSNRVGTSFTEVSKEMAERSTGLFPQLLNEIDHTPRMLESLINSPHHVAEQKFDGERRMVHRGVGDSAAIGSNRKALQVALPVDIAASMNGVVCTLDGEIIGDTLYAFDLLAINGVDLRGQGFFERKTRLDNIAHLFGDAIKVVADAVTPDEKRALVERARAMGQEGVVFKRVDAPYVAGRPTSGGDQLKAKNWRDATVICLGSKSDRLSIRIGVIDNRLGTGEVVEVGAVNMIGKGAVAEGDLLDVKYLYAFDGGSLFEATFKRVRTDLDRADANIGQLHFKKPHADVSVERELLAA